MTDSSIQRGVVTVVGSINRDLTMRVARLPGPGETLLATGLHRHGGGKGANQAVAASRAGGAHTLMVGAVGQDDDGEALLRGLQSAGVDTSCVARSDTDTGLALITVDDRGENTIVVAPGANHAWRCTDAVRGAVARADVVLGQLEVGQNLLTEAASARRPGAIFVLNAAPSAALSGELLRQIDVLVVNEHEARDLADVSDVDLAGQHLAELLDGATVIVTLGANGCVRHRHGEAPMPVPAPQVIPVDTVAAGDTFCGVLAAVLAQGHPELQAIRLSSTAASLAVQRTGAQDSIPPQAEVIDRMASVYPLETGHTH